MDITGDLTIIGARAGSTAIQQTVNGERGIHIVTSSTVSINSVTISRQH
ncbi:MAG: hypothetical protein ACP5QU_06690 [Anaerolineae bacterium]